MKFITSYSILHTLGIFMILSCSSFSQVEKKKEMKRNPLGIVSDSGAVEVKLKLVARTQSFNSKKLKGYDYYDPAISSPKSIIFSKDGKKYYVHSLEGYTTHVFKTMNHQKIKDIKHGFGKYQKKFFKDDEFTIFNYKQKEGQENYNYFSGKPVESCLSHDGKYLWVTYYRRNWDKNAQYPSAVAIIDTETDKIVRVMPTGPLPKMIAASANNKYIAVTHWGDNTVAIIDIDSENPFDFEYIKHCPIGKRIKLFYDEEVEVDRDNNCGHCLRGTVFTEDSKYLLVGRMGGAGGISVLETENFKSIGTVRGMKKNVRHLEVLGDELFMSSNRYGYVQKCNVNDMITTLKSKRSSFVTYNKFKSAYVGIGARTISLTKDGKYIFAAVNNEKKIVVVRSKDMKVISKIDADPYPVGMSVSRYETRLIVTAQGKREGGGNSVTIYAIEYLDK